MEETAVTNIGNTAQGNRRKRHRRYDYGDDNEVTTVAATAVSVVLVSGDEQDGDNKRCSKRRKVPDYGSDIEILEDTMVVVATGNVSHTVKVTTTTTTTRSSNSSAGMVAIVTLDVAERAKMKQAAREYKKTWLEAQRKAIKRDFTGPMHMKRMRFSVSKLVVNACIECVRHQTEDIAATDKKIAAFLRLLTPRVFRHFSDESVEADEKSHASKVMQSRIRARATAESVRFTADDIAEQIRLDFICDLYQKMKKHVKHSRELDEQQRDTFLKAADDIRSEMIAQRLELDEEAKICGYLHMRLHEIKEAVSRMSQRKVFECTPSGIPVQFNSISHTSAPAPLTVMQPPSSGTVDRGSRSTSAPGAGSESAPVVVVFPFAVIITGINR